MVNVLKTAWKHWWRSAELEVRDEVNARSTAPTAPPPAKCPLSQRGIRPGGLKSPRKMSLRE
eukprot:15454672-Alexandrium_andersonii.AAC.1